jgi:hypothetical protein
MYRKYQIKYQSLLGYRFKSDIWAEFSFHDAAVRFSDHRRIDRENGSSL